MVKAKVVKIENDIVFLEFPDLSVRKFFKDDFVKEPYLKQKVIILDNGSIIEEMQEKKDVVPKVPNKKSQIFSIILLILYIFFIIYCINNNFLLLESIELTIFAALYILATLVLYSLSTYYVNSKIINTVFKTLGIILLAIFSLYIVYYFITSMFIFIACLACL